MTILVTGASGKIAQHLIPSLRRDGHRVRAMVRAASQAPAWHQQGVEAVVADFGDRAALRRALVGVSTLALITPPHEHAAAWAGAAVAAARDAGVGRVVRLSAILAGPDGPSDNNRQHGRTDEEIRRCGIPYVILRPHFFMQNLLADVPTINTEATLYAATGDARLGMIDVRDIAATLRCALVETRWDGKAYDLTGPSSVSFHEIAEQLSRQLGREIRYAPISPAEVARRARSMGFGDWGAQTYHDYLKAYAAGWGDFTTACVSEITGRPARSFAQFARDILVPALTPPIGRARTGQEYRGVGLA